MNGPQAITPSDMLAWSTLGSQIVRVEEWEVLRRMDQAFLDAVGEEMEAASDRAKARTDANAKGRRQ